MTIRTRCRPALSPGEAGATWSLLILTCAWNLSSGDAPLTLLSGGMAEVFDARGELRAFAPEAGQRG
jgi:hypothetical protein